METRHLKLDVVFNFICFLLCCDPHDSRAELVAFYFGFIKAQWRRSKVSDDGHQRVLALSGQAWRVNAKFRHRKQQTSCETWQRTTPQLSFR